MGKDRQIKLVNMDISNYTFKPYPY